jgi:DNA invertase Pin-like site-specific DNA recombinase
MSVCLSVCVSYPAQPTSGRAVGEGEFACIDVAQVKSQSMAKTVLPLLKASKVPKVHVAQVKSQSMAKTVLPLVKASMVLKVPKVKNKMQAAVYTRISTKTNEKKSGTLRQLKACYSKAKDDGVQVTRSVSEVVSGSLPVSHRVAFNELMGQTDLNKIYVESVRAVARDAMVAEHYYQMSKRTGKQIIPADMPNLFKHDENPAEKFARRTMCAAIELEKDLAVERMRNGLEKKKLSTKEVTQVGAKKANGRKTLLDKVVVSATKIRKMRGFFKDLRYVHMHLGAEAVVCTCMGHPTCTESSQVLSVWGVVHRKRLSLCQV